jgi:transcriptional regulator with XRE-family HTH domain
MANKYELIGQLIKEARHKEKLTREEFAERIGKSTRYIASIENEGSKPSFNVLADIIRTLNIDANTIFYPESKIITKEKDELIRLLSVCDERSIKIILATAKAAIENQ